MAGKHILEGLIRWSTRERWAERFEWVLECHLAPTCEEIGIEIADIASAIGEDLFMSTVWACAFEDFLTREFDGENATDDYLKRRGWKESASVRNYMAALRKSTMSLYEVSDIVPGTSFLARDLLRDGEPILVSERSATQSLKPWDRIAARVVDVGSRTQIGGGVLGFDHETSELLIEAVRKLESLSSEEERELAEANGYEFDEDAFSDLSPTERLRAIAPMFTTFWLVDAIDRIQSPRIPDLRNAEGDEVMLCEARFPLAARTTGRDIRAALEARPEFRATSSKSWSWVSEERGVAKPAAAASEHDGPSREPLTLETWSDEGRLVLGDIRLEDKTLVLSANSEQRCGRGCALLSDALGGRLRQPSVKTESIEQIMASREPAMPNQPDIPAEEQRAIVHDYMDRHYRDVLDQPVPALGGQTPRAAVKTEGGRIKVVEWLKIMENRTAKPADPDDPMASYNFGWLWTELGLSERRE
ncbi:hypothetical protein FXV83_24480 [Bradyrhizobium hipponense]|uniref:Antitoxin Xre/MbcA/ParS-like toxin-binding domain-containing protein n=1 Tax=Bradyrhizobium hipponense TaxID=2605638 RepID=A0A5S4YKG7_9BRAD|nr:hypothetical protein [Bradyrhizobium hipponense]TYO63967.1 hypothetical protein FXV83_24480 [Bradyrhizobium hipponense]